MPVIKIDLWEGRNKEMKRDLIRNVTGSVSKTLGIPVERIQIILNEVSKDDWGINGVQVSYIE